jgi:ABC-type transporter Mla MlaB component
MWNCSDTTDSAKDGAMPFELQTAADGVKLTLTGRLGVRQAKELWDAVQPVVAAGQRIRVQAEELEEMDTSIIQILCRLSSQTGRLQIGGTSDGFLVSLQRRGLEKFFVQAPSPIEAKPQTPPRKVPAETTTTSRKKRPRHG